MSDANMSNIIQILTEVWYHTATNLLKITALLAYARIFRISRSFRLALWITGAAVVVWWTIYLILLFVLPYVQCTPHQKAITPLTPGHCPSVNRAWYLTSPIINVLFDLVVLVLPLPMIWKLQVKIGQKMQVFLMFFLGYRYARLCTLHSTVGTNESKLGICKHRTFWPCRRTSFATEEWSPS